MKNEKTILIEHKENGKWVKVADVYPTCKLGHMAAFKYIWEFLGLHIVDSRHTRKGETRVHYYKTEATMGGFDFRATF